MAIREDLKDSENYQLIAGLDENDAAQELRFEGDEVKVVLADFDDNATNAIKTIAYEHHEIHGGSSFVVSDIQNVDTTNMVWMITTPNTTKWGHMLFAFDCTGEMSIVVTEGADRTGTNALTAINRDRNSLTAATVTAHRAVSGGTTDGATTIFSHRSGATGVASKTLTSGGLRGSNEFILAQNTKYIITVTTYANVWVTATFDWYEHTNK